MTPEIVLIGREAGSGTRDGFESISGTKDKCQYRPGADLHRRRYHHRGQQPRCHRLRLWPPSRIPSRPLNVDGVAPSEATVKDGSYVVQRPFVLVTKWTASPSPQRPGVLRLHHFLRCSHQSSPRPARQSQVNK